MHQGVNDTDWPEQILYRSGGEALRKKGVCIAPAKKMIQPKTH